MSIIINPLDSQVSHENSFIPQSSFQGMIIAPIGGGKTTLMVNLLLNNLAFKGKFNKIYWVSPTAHLDSKVREFLMKPSERIIIPNKKLMKLLITSSKKNTKTGSMRIGVSGFNSIGECDQDIKTTCEFIETTQPRPLIESDFIKNDTSFGFFKDILKEQDATIKKYSKPLANNILVILDDSAAYKKAFLSESTINAVITSRHYKITTIIATQAYYMIPKSIRLNCALKVIFRISNIEEIKQIADENSCDFTRDDFMHIYNRIHETDHAFATINLLNKRGYKLADCFNRFIRSVNDI